MEFPKEFPKNSQNYIDYPSNISPGPSQNSIGATEKAECKTCSWTGRTGQSLGSHLVSEKNSVCRRLYVEEMERESWEKKWLEYEAKSDQPSSAKVADCLSDAELNMLVPQVKIRLAKERPFK